VRIHTSKSATPATASPADSRRIVVPEIFVEEEICLDNARGAGARVRRHALVHLGVLLLPLFALPIAVTGEPPPPTGTPVW
jgi:hypothetical protein